MLGKKEASCNLVTFNRSPVTRRLFGAEQYHIPNFDRNSTFSLTKNNNTQWKKTQFGSKAHAPPFFEVIKFFQPWKIPSVPAICVTEFTRGDTTAPPRHTAYWQYFLQLLFGTQSANCNDFFPFYL